MFTKEFTALALVWLAALMADEKTDVSSYEADLASGRGEKAERPPLLPPIPAAYSD